MSPDLQDFQTRIQPQIHLHHINDVNKREILSPQKELVVSKYSKKMIREVSIEKD